MKGGSGAAEGRARQLDRGGFGLARGSGEGRKRGPQRNQAKGTASSLYAVKNQLHRKLSWREVPPVTGGEARTGRDQTGSGRTDGRTGLAKLI